MLGLHLLQSAARGGRLSFLPWFIGAVAPEDGPGG